MVREPDQVDWPRDWESCNKSHANPSWFKAAAGECLLTWKGNGQDGKQAGQTKWNQRLVLTGTCPHHDISDQAVALNWWTVCGQSAALQSDECRWTNSDVCQSWWIAFPRSWTFNMKRLTTLSSPSSCSYLHTPWSRLKRRTMYACIFVYSLLNKHY